MAKVRASGHSVNGIDTEWPLNVSSPSVTDPMLRWSTEHRGYTIEVQLGIVTDSQGFERLDAVEVAVSSDSKAVTSDALHRVPVARLVRQAITERVAPAIEALSGPVRQTVVVDAVDNELVTRIVNADLVAPTRDAHWQAVRTRLNEAAESRPGPRRRITEDFLREVARVVRQVQKETQFRGQVHHEAARRLHTTPSTLSRWIAMARDPKRGYLPPSGHQRKGQLR